MTAATAQEYASKARSLALQFTALQPGSEMQADACQEKARILEQRLNEAKVKKTVTSNKFAAFIRTLRAAFTLSRRVSVEKMDKSGEISAGKRSALEPRTGTEGQSGGETVKIAPPLPKSPTPGVRGIAK